MVIETDESVDAAKQINLNAPLVTTAGPIQQGQSLGSGGSRFEGGFTNTGGQITSNGVTLETHVHGGVKGGNDESGQPVADRGDQGDCEGECAQATVESVIPCLPAIAKNMANEEKMSASANEKKIDGKTRDELAWTYLSQMFTKWLSAKSADMPECYQDPFTISFEWILMFPQAKREYDNFIRTGGQGGNNQFRCRHAVACGALDRKRDSSFKGKNRQLQFC